MNQYIRPTLALFIGLTLITGVAYPLATTGLGKMLFPQQAAGSLIERDGKIVGSTLIGQNFSTPQYFWGRPSATAPYPYNAAASSGTNQGPLNPALADAVKARIATLKAADPDSHLPVPVDLVTASASGLDPEISPAAALFQVRRVAQARQLAEDSVKSLVNEYTQGRQWGLLGEPRVNVLQLNLALDDMARHSAPLKQ